MATVLYGPAVGSAVYRIGNAMENTSEIIGAAKAFDKSDYTGMAIKAGGLILGKIKDVRLDKVAAKKNLNDEDKLGATVIGDIVIDKLKDELEKKVDTKEN